MLDIGNLPGRTSSRSPDMKRRRVWPAGYLKPNGPSQATVDIIHASDNTMKNMAPLDDITSDAQSLKCAALRGLTPHNG